MKKVLLSLCLALAALAGSAQTNYNENLVVTVDGESMPAVPASVTVTENADGTCDFSLVNFWLKSEDSNLPIGTIRLTGVKMEEHTYYKAISTTQTITIEPGDDPDVPADGWVGPSLGLVDDGNGNIEDLGVPIVLEGRFTTDHLYANIDIDMMSSLGQIINVVVGDQTTAISTVTVPAARSQAVYTLSGIRVADSWNANLPKGVYVVGGKKVIK